MEWYSLYNRAEKLRPVNIIIGGRGIGKTYNTIDYVLNQEKPFIYLRNTKTQLDLCASAFGNPFKKWNEDHGRHVFISSHNNYSLIYEEKEELKPLIGYAAALSTFENLRGVDLSDCEYVIFDEFCERKTLAFKQFETFANFYETVNRNRELTGGEPLKVFLLSNSQKLDNPILAGYGAIPIIEQMIKAGREEYTTELMYINLPKSNVSEAKKETVNYRLTAGSRYYQEAIENKFANDSFAGIGKKPLAEYKPVCMIDDLYIWQHKSTGKYYICRTASNKVQEYNSRDTLPLFLRRYGIIFRMAAAEGRIEYMDYLSKVTFLSLIN